jgi:hypothetical protein
MAEQCGHLLITGTIDNVCFYKMEGKYYLRMKSSLTRQRVLKNTAFRRTREHAATLGEASKIASRVYRLMPKEDKKHALYREMTGKAIYLLRGGKDKETIFQHLCKEYVKTELPAQKEGLNIATKAQRHEASQSTARDFKRIYKPEKLHILDQKDCFLNTKFTKTTFYSKVREHITSDVRLPAPKLKKTYCGLPARAPTRARKSFAAFKIYRISTKSLRKK